MSNDFDSLDDIFADEASKKARPVGKFQPKAKFRPQKKGPAKTSVASSQTVQTIDSAPSDLSEPIATANPSEQSSNGVSNDNAELHAVTEQPVGQNADISTGLEAPGDVLPHTMTDKECSVPPSAAVDLNVPNSENIVGSESSILFSVEDSTHTSHVVDFPTYPGLSAEVASVTAGEPIVASIDLHDTAHDRDPGREAVDALDSIDMNELPAKYGLRKGRFQPKQKPQMPKHIQVSEPVSNSLGSQFVPPEVVYAEMDSVPKSHQDDVLDLSSLGFTHTSRTEATSELPLNEESMNLMEVAELDMSIHLDNLPEIPAKLASRRAKTGTSNTHAASDLSSQQQSSQEIGTGRSVRKRKGKSNICELVDEDRDEVLATGDIEACSPIEEENINNDENQVESGLQKKKSKRKSKKADDGKEKPAKKSKKAKEASDQGGAKRGKFSHSTRRRRVDKTLLETPEDEIDHQRLPLRDLIILAEHREREMKRAGPAAGASATNQSTGNSSGLYNDGDFNSEEGGEYNDEQGSTPMIDTTEYFNYQSHMDKTRTKRWSKQETELFYEAVRMFGSDLSMITVRLPGRSRREVKLKYKKEERQHPLMLHEALANRSKDRSQFEMVVNHLRKIAAEENGDDAESMDLPEGTPNADDDEAKEEHIEGEENDNAANEDADVEIPVKLDEEQEEDDDNVYDFFSDYKGLSL
ncbi:hypothetical protein ACS0TY_000726 [Phlomoides rotata]